MLCTVFLLVLVMSLESKAKTTLELYQSLKQAFERTAMTFAERDNYDLRKWVLLEDAQKELASVLEIERQIIKTKNAKLEAELLLYKTPDIELAKMIDHAALADYLRFLKWRETSFPRKGVIVFQWIEQTETTTTLVYQINLATDTSFRDYDSTVIRAAQDLGLFLNQERKKVLVDLVLRCQKKP